MSKDRSSRSEERPLNALAVLAVLTEASWLYFRQFPEIVPFGEEMGLAASGLALSYISAFIFRRLVVLRPERQRRERIYAANWGSLCLVSYNAQGLVHDFECIAGKSKPRSYNSTDAFDEITEEYFRELVEPLSVKVAGHFATRAQVWREHWGALKPYLHEFDEGLVIRLRKVEAVSALKTIGVQPEDLSQPADYSMDYFSDGRPFKVGKGWKQMWEYVAATEELRHYVSELPLDLAYLDESPRFQYFEPMLHSWQGARTRRKSSPEA